MTNKIRNIETGQEESLSSLHATWAETAASMPLQMLLPGSLPKLSPCWMYFKELLSQIEQERSSLLCMLRSNPEREKAASGDEQIEGLVGLSPSGRRCSEQGSCTAGEGNDDDRVPLIRGWGRKDNGVEDEAEAPLRRKDNGVEDEAEATLRRAADSPVFGSGNSATMGPSSRQAAAGPHDIHVEVKSSMQPMPYPTHGHLPNASWTAHSNLSFGSSSSLLTTASSRGDSESGPDRLPVNEVVRRLEELFGREIQLR